MYRPINGSLSVSYFLVSLHLCTCAQDFILGHFNRRYGNCINVILASTGNLKLKQKNSKCDFQRIPVIFMLHFGELSFLLNNVTFYLYSDSKLSTPCRYSNDFGSQYYADTNRSENDSANYV